MSPLHLRVPFAFAVIPPIFAVEQRARQRVQRPGDRPRDIGQPREDRPNIAAFDAEAAQRAVGVGALIGAGLFALWQATRFIPGPHLPFRWCLP
jgi:hypothetical protein